MNGRHGKRIFVTSINAARVPRREREHLSLKSNLPAIPEDGRQIENEIKALRGQS
ncbi:MAG: hypothetical protein V4662_06475 [Verrucomicrobiota bacterium]